MHSTRIDPSLSRQGATRIRHSSAELWLQQFRFRQAKTVKGCYCHYSQHIEAPPRTSCYPPCIALILYLYIALVLYLYPGHWIVVYTNVGWSSSYIIPFDTAGQFFQQRLCSWLPQNSSSLYFVAGLQAIDTHGNYEVDRRARVDYCAPRNCHQDDKNGDCGHYPLQGIISESHCGHVQCRCRFG